MRKNGRLGPHKAPAGRFTGKKKKGTPRKRGSSRAQRRTNRGTHTNRYA